MGIGRIRTDVVSDILVLPAGMSVIGCLPDVSSEGVRKSC